MLFLLFFTRFRKSSFFCFFLFSLSLFSLRLPLTLRLKKLHFCHHGTFRLSLFAHSLSLFSREEEEKEYESRSKVPSLRPVVFRAREIRVVFFNALRFFCKFLGEEKPSLPRRTSFKRKRRKSRESKLSRDLDSLETSLTLPFLSFQSRISRAVEPDERYPHPQAHPEHLRRGIRRSSHQSGESARATHRSATGLLQSKIHRPHVRYSS